VRQAVERGVTVEIVTAKGFNQLAEDLPFEGGDNAEVLRKLAAGIEAPCDRLQARWFSWDGISAIAGNGPHASHAKYASIDGEVAIIGSANMDTQSWSQSREVVVIVDDATMT